MAITANAAGRLPRSDVPDVPALVFNGVPLSVGRIIVLRLFHLQHPNRPAHPIHNQSAKEADMNSTPLRPTYTTTRLTQRFAPHAPRMMHAGKKANT